MSDVQDDVVAPVTPAPEATPEPVATAPEPTAGQESEKKPEAKTFTEDDVNKIVQKRLAKESRRIQREVQLEVENSVLRQQNAPKPAPVGEPKVEDFKDYDSYNRALIKAEAEKQAAVMFSEFQRSQQAAQVQAQVAEQRQKLEKAASKYEDFHEVAMNEAVPIDKPTAAFITESEHGADVAYYLGSNLNEAERIARLSPIQQIRALAQIEAKFSSPQKKQTTAPEPVKPIGTGASLAKDIEKMSMAEYKEWRRKNGARY